MEKIVFNALLETGIYEEFSVKQVRERAASLSQLVATGDENQVAWGLTSLDEFGESTVNQLRQIARKVIVTCAQNAPEIPVPEAPLQEAPPETFVQPEPQTDAPPPGEPNGVQQNIG